MRYRTLDVPPAHPGAFSPTMATNPPASSWGICSSRQTGWPGTLPVPVRNPAEWTPALSAAGHSVNSAQGSDVAPDYILPAVYVNRPVPQCLPHLIDNILPAPALSSQQDQMSGPGAGFLPSAVARPAMRAPQVGGRSVTAWPRAFQRWSSPPDPNYRG